MKIGEIRMRGWVLSVILVGALAVGGLLGSLATAQTGRAPFGAGHTVPLLVADSAPVATGKVSLQDGFTPVVEKVLPAVVNISSSKMVKTQGGQNPLFNDPFFQQFFGSGRQFGAPREQREHSLGSGVIVSPDGYILTNNHVVEGATDIKVALSDHRVFKGKIIGTDKKTDIAVVKIDATNLPVVTLGNSSHVKVGQFVLAIGDPFGVGETVTMGIVSATGRSGLGIEDYEDFIQTDAAINPGNSGGALINVNGELVGINTAILTGGGGGNQGIGFAIPINMARNVMQQILKHGKVIRGWLGVYIQQVTPALADSFGLKTDTGALVGDVEPNSPASKAGLKKGDIIQTMDGRQVIDSRDLRLRVAETAPNTTVRFGILRNGTPQEISVTLGELPSGSSKAGTPGGGGGSAMEGVQVDNLTPDIAQQLNLPANTVGVVVSSVADGTAAAEAGLRRGDVIEEVNRKPIRNVSDYNQALQSVPGGKGVLLLVNRGGVTSYVVVSNQ